MPSKEAESGLKMLRDMLALPQFAALNAEYDIRIAPKGGQAKGVRPAGRRASYGSIDRLGNGKWRLRYPAWDEGRRVRKSMTITGATRRDAEAQLARLRQEYEHPDARMKCPTFAQCWEDWHGPWIESRYAEGKISRSTRDIYRNAWRHHISPAFADLQMCRLSPEQYARWMDSLSDGVRRLAGITLKQMAATAMTHGVEGLERISKYTAGGTAWEPDGGKAEQTYTRAEVDSLLGLLRGTTCEIPAILMAYGSCRCGEACAVSLDKVSSYEVGGRVYAVAYIDCQLVERGEGIKKPKTRESVRHVVIPEPWSLRVLEVAEANRAAGLTFLNDSGDGTPVRRAGMQARWRETVKGSGMRYLPMTKLRNSWATWMLWDLGIDSRKVDKMMGHSTGDILARHYDRPDYEMFAETLDEALLRSNWAGFRNRIRDK